VLSHLVLILGCDRGRLPGLRDLHRLHADLEQIHQQAPMSLLPGGHMLETYRIALFGGTTSYGSKVAPVAPMMWVSLVSALIIAIGKIAISLLSAFAIVYFRFPFRDACASG
jgi:sn-glycerol 3-phosphate transport system permease protein